MSSTLLIVFGSSIVLSVTCLYDERGPCSHVGYTVTRPSVGYSFVFFKFCTGETKENENSPMPSVAALKSLLKIRNSLGDNKHIGTNLLFFAFFLRAIFFKEIKDGLLLSRKENNNLFY